MICQSEYYSFECLWTRKDSHWFWLFIPLGLVIVCLLYIFSRPNYARLTTRTYQPLNRRKNLISFYPQKQQNNVLDQYAKYSTPTSSSTFLFEQRQEKNNSRLHLDNTKHKTIHEFNNNSLVNFNSSQDTDAATQAWRIKNHPLLSDSNHLGRIGFSLAYNPRLRQLYLTIIKARNLRSINHCQPSTFVRAYIGPRFNATFFTDVMKENANPDYMIKTIFSINPTEFSTNVLKLTVYEIDKEVFDIPIGTIYYPLEHLLIARGHMIWRDLLPEYGDPSATGLVQIRATVWYDANDEYLNIDVHSLRAMGIVNQVYHAYVRASIALHDEPILPEEQSPCTHGKYGPIVSLERSKETIYNQLFRFPIPKHKSNVITVVLDAYHRSLTDAFVDDILLGRTVIVSSEMSQSTSIGEKGSLRKKKHRFKKLRGNNK